MLSTETKGRGVNEIEEAIRAAAEAKKNTAKGHSREEIATGAMTVLFESLDCYTDEQLEVLYSNLVGEVIARGLEEEIMGESPDAAGISLNDEMNEMIKMVRQMRTNLDRQTASGKIVSNRDIRETLAACVTTIKTLTSHQKSIRNMERQRILENTLIEVLGEMSEEAQLEFQRTLRERLEELSE